MNFLLNRQADPRATTATEDAAAAADRTVRGTMAEAADIAETAPRAALHEEATTAELLEEATTATTEHEPLEHWKQNVLLFFLISFSCSFVPFLSRNIEKKTKKPEMSCFRAPMFQQECGFAKDFAGKNGRFFVFSIHSSF